MRFLVVYESMFGNTEEVARAIARGLGEHGEVEVDDVAVAPSAVGPGVALVAAGGPTHAFAMTRPQTRAAAVKQGAGVRDLETGLREWLSTVVLDEAQPPLATFDTRVDKV